MAIPYARFTIVSLTELAGATTNVAYILRDRINDPRLPGGAVDYIHLAGDVSYQDVWLPDAHLVRHYDSASLARAIDSAELSKVIKPLDERQRPPQAGFALVVALPAPHEASLHEAIEITQRIALHVRGSSRLTIHLAIHEAGTNRHAHYLFSTRPIDANGKFGLKQRDFVARVRPRGDQAKVKVEVKEGIHWPNLSWETQQAFFVELGTDLIVDPIAPSPMKHLTDRNELPAARLDYRSANIDIIKGPPLLLVDGLLRGRSTLPVAAVRQLCGKFFVDGGDSHIDRILMGKEIVTYADLRKPSTAAFVTTKPVHDLLTLATEILDQQGQSTVVAATGADEPAVVVQIARLCENASADRPLLLAEALSNCEATANVLSNPETRLLRIDGLESTAITDALALRPGRPVIVPHAELIEDQPLASLIVAAKKAGSKLVLGHVQGAQTGTVRRQLAAYAADVLASPEIPAEQDASDVAGRLLRAGLVRHAVELMVRGGFIAFGDRLDHRPHKLEFIVCDDPTRLVSTHNVARGADGHSGLHYTPIAPSIVQDALSVGEWFVTTDKLVSNEAIECGEFFQIAAIDRASGVTDVMIWDERQVIDLKLDHAHIQPAAAISLRQAFGLTAPAQLTIEATDPRRVWAALLLAARYNDGVKIFVDPQIARNQLELVEAARRSLFAALPHQRTQCRDANADASMLGDQFFWEELPKNGKDSTPAPIIASQEVRNRLAYSASARSGLKLLQDLCSSRNPSCGSFRERALDAFSPITKAFVRHYAGEEVDGFTARHKHAQSDPDADLDLPPDLDEPTNWTIWEVQLFIWDLSSLELEVRLGRFRDLPNPLVPWQKATLCHNDRRHNRPGERDMG
ncbi:MobA/MobL family protein [Bradyrhizobium barranii]|uniref:MobA/MobL family protein n=1 Tax=Bradyrhizobium TaxID=374 RepID=UPI003F28718C